MTAAMNDGKSWAEPGPDTYPTTEQPPELASAPWTDGTAPDGSPSQIRRYNGTVAAVRVMPTMDGVWTGMVWALGRIGAAEECRYDFTTRSDAKRWCDEGLMRRIREAHRAK